MFFGELFFWRDGEFAAGINLGSSFNGRLGPRMTADDVNAGRRRPSDKIQRGEDIPRGHLTAVVVAA